MILCKFFYIGLLVRFTDQYLHGPFVDFKASAVNINGSGQESPLASTSFILFPHFLRITHTLSDFYIILYFSYYRQTRSRRARQYRLLLQSGLELPVRRSLLLPLLLQALPLQMQALSCGKELLQQTIPLQ